ncbi:DUF317 domain-containing protein [Streptomyces sp. NBC_00377]|uniref:DUF317 domain-containing protein n=1 Tax=unclassified Streptomyces TaxID=2593676 RepID=UPI002E21FA93|nr:MULTISPECIES: DUF317 domain-containing protein [unclassified Streptomyces]
MSDTVEQALITPRYLAGGGDPGWITVPLHRAAGRSYGHEPLTPRVLLTSLDQLIQLRLDPDPDDPGWWTIRHTRTADHPGWTATFDARTPVEIIAAFTDALTDPSGPPTAPDPCDPSWIPGLARDRMTVHTHHVAAPDIAFALERRVSALAARHRPATTAPPAPHGRSPRRTR